MSIYFAYGSNTNRRHMLRRCPDAKPLGKFWLKSSRLVFRGVADCVYEPGSKCPGVLWRLTKRCEEALDRYEGVSSNSAYRKEVCDLKGFPGEKQLMLYVMNSTGIFPPSESYLDVIREGYREFKLPLDLLDKAVEHSWDEKHPSHLERKRFMRNGRPRLARPLKTGTLATGNSASIQEESVQ